MHSHGMHSSFSRLSGVIFSTNRPLVSSSTTARISAFPLVDKGEQALASADRRLGDLDHQPDANLIARLREGDKEAFSSLFRRHARCVYVVGHKILRDSSEADDLVQ